MTDDWRRGPRRADLARLRGTVPRVPNKRAPGVRLHAFGIPDELWERVQAAAKYNDNEAISEVVRKALVAYVKRTERKKASGQ